MTKQEAIRAQALIDLAAPYRIPAEQLRFFASRPLRDGIAVIASAKHLVDQIRFDPRPATAAATKRA